MIKSKRRINKAMLVANVIPFRSQKYKQLAFYSVRFNDFLAIPSHTVAEGWRQYGYMVNQEGMGGRWANGDGRFEGMRYKRVSS